MVESWVALWALMTGSPLLLFIDKGPQLKGWISIKVTCLPSSSSSRPSKYLVSDIAATWNNNYKNVDPAGRDRTRGRGANKANRVTHTTGVSMEEVVRGWSL